MTRIVPNRRVTQAGVAAIVGCSQNTVALALRDSKRVSEAKRIQIRKLAEQLGYRPNPAARNLVLLRSGLVGLFTGNLDPVRTQIVAELISSLHSTEYKPILGVDTMRPDPWYSAPWIETFRDLRVEALVAIAWTDKVALPEWYQQVPLVFAACQPDPTLPCDYVALDRVAAGRMATEYLIKRGHKRIVALANLPTRLLVKGYTESMLAARLEPRFVGSGNSDEADQLMHLTKAVEQFRDDPKRPTAAVVVNSRTAVEFCEVLRHAGLRVPEDMAVVGYDRIPMVDRLRIPLTSIEQPVQELAARTVEFTRQRLADPARAPEHITLDHQLIVRESA